MIKVQPNLDGEPVFTLLTIPNNPLLSFCPTHKAMLSAFSSILADNQRERDLSILSWVLIPYSS